MHHMRALDAFSFKRKLSVQNLTAQITLRKQFINFAFIK
jgi:hypothetical protein